MLTLALDTSGDVCVLALGREDVVLGEYRFQHKMSLLRRLLPNIELLMSDAGYKVSDVEGFIVGLGPGSFTGLRIGVTVAKTLAYSLNKPIVGVGSLDALAYSVAPVGTQLMCPMVHARADEVYWTIVGCSGGDKIADYRVSSIGEVANDIANRNLSTYFCGSAALRHSQFIRERLGELAVIGNSGAAHPSGWGLLLLGRQRIVKGERDDPIAITPLYVRKPTPVLRLESGEIKSSDALC